MNKLKERLSDLTNEEIKKLGEEIHKRIEHEKAERACEWDRRYNPDFYRPFVDF